MTLTTLPMFPLYHLGPSYFTRPEGSILSGIKYCSCLPPLFPFFLLPSSPLVFFSLTANWRPTSIFRSYSSTSPRKIGTFLYSEVSFFFPRSHPEVILTDGHSLGVTSNSTRSPVPTKDLQLLLPVSRLIHFAPTYRVQAPGKRVSVKRAGPQTFSRSFSPGFLETKLPPSERRLSSGHIGVSRLPETCPTTSPDCRLCFERMVPVSFPIPAIRVFPSHT